MRRSFRRSIRVCAGFALASALCVPAAAAQFDYFIKLPPIEGETSGDKHKNQIEILSYSWGVTRSPGGGQADALTDGLLIIRYNTAPAGSAAAQGEKGGTEDINIGVGELQEAGKPAMTAPRDAASGLPTGKRQHKPMMLTAPLAKGSLTVRGKFPGCVVGTRYPSLTLGGRGKRYTLQDAIITSCARASGGALPMEEVSFNYAKISF